MVGLRNSVSMRSRVMWIRAFFNTYKRRVIAAGGIIEGEQCAVNKMNASPILKQASWLLIQEGYEEDTVFVQKPTSGGDLTFTRSSDATRTNSAGQIERVAWNLFTYSEMFSDASWSKTNVTIGIDSIVAPNGTLTADKITATAVSANHFINRGFTLTGQHTVSIYAKAGEYQFLRMQELNGGKYNCVFDLSAGTATGTGATIQNAGNGWYRCIVVFDPAGAGISTGFIGIPTATSGVNYTGNGTSGIFIWGAQLVEGTEAKPYLMTTNRQDVPRLDYRNADGTVSTCPRLLLEPQRTNGIRNSTMVGAVAGSPGTLPTNWNTGGTSGLTQTIVGVGTENGLQYIDLRLAGTANASTVQLRFDGSTNIAALTAQTWTESIYLKSISGAPNNTFQLFVERNSTGGYVTESQSSALALTSTLKRFDFTRALSGGASTAFVQPCVLFLLTIGATYDFTIRIAAPQMELGAYATTFIPTTTAAVTRTADAASKTGISSLIGQTEGTFYAEIDYSTATSGTFRAIGTIMAGTDYTRFRINTFNLISAETWVGGSFVSQVSGSGLINGINKVAFCYKNGEPTSVFLNGVLLASGPVVTTNPAGNELRVGIDTFNSSQFSNGFKSVALFPTRLDNDQLAELTTL